MTTSKRPVRVDQVIPSIVERDAVSSHTLQCQKVLRSMGLVSEIFACNWGPGLNGRIQPLAELPTEAGGGQWVCYQASIGSPAADAVVSHPGPVIVNYHNITPAEYVARWMPGLGEEVRLGRQQVAALAGKAELGIGVSAFNCSDLDAWGYKRTVVAPLMMDTRGFERPPDRQLGDALSVAKRAGGADWLFVGQMLPHKAHEDVVKAFACYLEAFDADARLHLIGRPSCGEYALAVKRLIDQHGLARQVNLAGSVTAEELAAYYGAADVFVCCSNHEGYCAPLLEAMHHEVPVVAFATAAVPETVLGAAITLPSKEPALVAAAAHRVVTDATLREMLIDQGKERARSFTLEGAKRAFADAVESAIAGR